MRTAGRCWVRRAAVRDGVGDPLGEAVDGSTLGIGGTETEGSTETTGPGLNVNVGSTVGLGGSVGSSTGNVVPARGALTADPAARPGDAPASTTPSTTLANATRAGGRTATRTPVEKRSVTAYLRGVAFSA